MNMITTSYILQLFIVVTNLFSLCNGVLYHYVTCNSVIKLQQTRFSVRLHSHEVQYGSGSGQQSVTGVEDADDINSHWVIKGPKGGFCQRGNPIKCGEAIRLEHLLTKKNLHSHLFSAPLSQGQEVSAFGKEGEGDTGDNWFVECDSDNWRRDAEVKLKHADTNMYLSVSGETFGHPIPGQMEIYAINYPNGNSYWKVNEGIFIKPNEMHLNKIHQHTEL